MRRKRFAVGSLALLAAGGACTGIAVATGPEAGAPAVLAESVTAPGAVPSSRRTPEQILEDAGRRIGRGILVGRRLGGSPAGFAPTEDPSAAVAEAYRTGRWAFFEIQRTPDTPLFLERLWKARLIAGVVRDDLYSDRLPVLVNGWVSYTLPSGEEARVDLVAGTATGQVFRRASPGDVRAQVQAGADRAHVTVKDVEIVDGLQPAPLVRVETSDPQGTARRLDDLVDTIFGGSFTYEGFFLDVRDATGRPVAVRAMAARVGIGTGWVRPDLGGGSFAPAPQSGGSPAGG